MKFKDILTSFEPLTEEEQKDLLYIVLDCMDFYRHKEEQSTTDEDKEKYNEHLETYQMFATLLTATPDWEKEIGRSAKRFLLKNARRDRLRWEQEKKKRSA